MADRTAKLLTCAEAGHVGGLARARKLTPEHRREIARRAAHARWAKKLGTPDPPSPTDPKGPHRDEQWAESGIMSTAGPRPVVGVSSTDTARSRDLAA